MNTKLNLGPRQIDRLPIVLYFKLSPVMCKAMSGEGLPPSNMKSWLNGIAQSECGLIISYCIQRSLNWRFIGRDLRYFSEPPRAAAIIRYGFVPIDVSEEPVIPFLQCFMSVRSASIVKNQLQSTYGRNGTAQSNRPKLAPPNDLCNSTRSKQNYQETKPSMQRIQQTEACCVIERIAQGTMPKSANLSFNVIGCRVCAHIHYPSSLDVPRLVGGGRLPCDLDWSLLKVPERSSEAGLRESSRVSRRLSSDIQFVLSWVGHEGMKGSGRCATIRSHLKSNHNTPLNNNSSNLQSMIVDNGTNFGIGIAA